MQALPKQADAGIDSAGSASTVVLREVHCALLRIIQGQAMDRDKKDAGKGQPTTAKLFSPDSSGPVPWTAQVAQAVLAAPAVGAAGTAKVRHMPPFTAITSWLFLSLPCHIIVCLEIIPLQLPRPCWYGTARRSC